MNTFVIALSFGVACAVVIAASGRITGFDKERGFYPTVLIVIASYYLLFAVMANDAIALETLGLVAFTVFAVFAAFKAYWLVGLGIVLHGLFDFLHPHVINNPGVPSWWAPFCAGVDVVLGLWVIYLGRQPQLLTGISAKP
jgi:hypothetical protein